MEASDRLTVGALVVYRGRPAVIRGAGTRLTVLTPEGERRVRPKDVRFLHPGPVPWPLPEGPAVDLAEAYALLGDEGEVPFADFVELVAGSYTPEAAWAVYRALAAGPWFVLEAERVRPRDRREVEALLARERRRAEEAARYRAALERFRRGVYAPEDRPLLEELAALALGRAHGARVLRDLGRKESPEEAHAVLLELGYWTPLTNPYPERYGLPAGPPRAGFGPPDDAGRVDLTALPAYAIDDDPASGDADDALAYSDGEVWVHVADVAAWVRPDEPADLAARERGSAVYLPERVVPMLPPGLLEAAALGGERSRALTFAFRLGGGRPRAVRVFPSWVRVERLSYREAEGRLGEAPFSELMALAEAFYRRRLGQGALDLSLPEVRVRVRQGRVELSPLFPFRSRFLVRELMLAAGEAAAGWAGGAGIPFPFSTQERRAPPGDLPADPLARAWAQRRTLSRTVYRTAPLPHAGLGLAAYAQVTSPLRRYLDLVAHQQLRAALAGVPGLSPGALIDRVGQAEAAAEAVRAGERASRTHFQLVWLLSRPGFETEGVVVEAGGGRVVALLPGVGLEVALAPRGDEAVGRRLALRLLEVDLPRLTARFAPVG